ncbi:sensor histidine kinase [Marilutibacter penaei]|nr:ATP-binding protein [Lysobacter penaei]
MPMQTTATLSSLPGDTALRLVMAASGIGMAIVSIDGHFVETNAVLSRMLGYAGEDLAGRSLQDVTHPDDRPLVEQFTRRLTHGPDGLLDARKRYLRRDGSMFWAQLNSAVIRDADGEPMYLLSQVRDISDEVQREEALRARADQRGLELEASHHQLQLFADAVAHDMRAPLRSIESFSQRLGQRLAPHLDDEAREHLQRIHSAANRMSSLLDGLGRLSRATRAPLNPRRVDLSLLAEWALAEQQDADPDRQVEISVEPGLLAEGDERLLKLMLDELAANAWVFTRGREAASIEVDGRCEGGRLRLRIRDNGTGFDMRYLHKLFEPFQRLHGLEDGAGHGLGLAIAQRVAERHGGRITAESRPGHGSTFTLELPVPPAGTGGT